MKLIGRFYFKQTINGNLIGEFSNNLISRIITESSNLEGEFSNPFIGRFRTIWHQELANTLVLTISNRRETENRIFELIWRDDEENEVFYGEGFIVDGILIGDYRDFKNE